MNNKKLDELCNKLQKGSMSEKEFQKAYCKIREIEDKTEFLWRDER